MSKFRYVIEIDTQKVNYEMKDGIPDVSSAAGQKVLRAFKNADVSDSIRNDLILCSGITIKSVQILD